MAKDKGPFRDSRVLSWVSGPPTDVPTEPPLIRPGNIIIIMFWGSKLL